MQKLKKEYLVGGILTVMGIVAIVMSSQITVMTGSTDPGSRLFPMLASVVLTICGIGVMLTAHKSTEKKFLDQKGCVKLLLSIVCMIAYILALKYIGFIISTPVFLFVIMTMFADGKKVAIWKKIVYSLVVTVLAWVVFQKLLAMPLPNGILF